MMPIKTMTWLAGVFCTSFLSELSIFIQLSIALSALFCFFCTKKFPWMLFPTLFLIGSFGSLLFAQYHLKWELPKQLENKKTLIVGWVNSVPEKEHQKIKFQFQVKKMNEEKVSTQIQLTWHHPPASLPLPGEKWQLIVKLKRPHSLMNPGGFDQEKFYFKEKIRALGYVIKSPKNISLESSKLSQTPNKLRLFLYEKMSSFVHENPFMGIVIALCLGIRNHISSEQWDIFQKTGTSHLVAISGLHMSLAAGFFHYLVEWVWRRSYYLMNKVPTQQAQALGAFLGGFIYSLLAGFSIPTQRALIMISALLLSVIFRRNISSWKAFSFALLIVVGIDPLATLSESFWLSFGAVFFIFYVTASRISFGKSLWSRYGKIQWSVTIALSPFTFLFFQQTSLISFPANLVAIPWVSFLVIPFALLGTFLLPISQEIAHWILWISSQLLKVSFIFLQYLAHFEYSRLYQSLPNLILAIALFLGTLLILSPKGIPARWLGILSFIPIFLYPKKMLPEKTIGFTLLDVGQGLSTVIQTRSHTLVFDTGAKFSDRFDMGKAVILPYLRSQGIKKLDILVVSHKDNDHMGGAQSILKDFPVQKVITSVPDYFDTQSVHICHRGQNWEWDGVQFKILYPLKGAPYVGNNSSCTLEIKTGNQRILITGDLEKKGEKDLLTLNNGHLSSLILVAGHHGSRTSSTESFAHQVQPTYALFSSGYLNQYHFPHPLIVKRFQKIGSLMENTADSGGIYFEITPNGITKKIKYRKLLRRYWHHQF